MTGNLHDSKNVAMTNRYTFCATDLKWMFVLLSITAWRSAVLAAGVADDFNKQKSFHETWVEEVPVMGHLAVAMDGTVLIFK